MDNAKNSLVVIIPAYEPQSEFEEYAQKVSECAHSIIVVNDGSGTEYDQRFNMISEIPNVIYLRHDVNKGKGCALKTAFDYAIKNFSEDTVLVTADCDGQHAVEDVVRVYTAALERPDALILGSRDFTKDNIPPKSQFGNSLFRVTYRWIYRLPIYDTQTGLRGFSVALAKEFLTVPGERFEYEMSVLIAAKHANIPIVEVPIQTIYPEARITHYRALKDTRKILFVVLKNARKPKKYRKKNK